MVSASDLHPGDAVGLLADDHDTVAIHRGRVVKTIGDEVLYAAEDPLVVLDIADIMIAESASLGLPPLRIGAEYGVAV